MGVDAGGDDVRIAAENAGHVFRRLTTPDSDFLRQHAQAVAAHLTHPQFKADAGAEGRLFQQEDKAAAPEIRAQFARPDGDGGVQDGLNLDGCQVRHGQEIAMRDGFGYGHGLCILPRS